MTIKPDHASSGDKVMGWGSDVVAEMLRRFDIEYVSINPGSSFRGLHDSVVNYLGNERPTLLLSLHEQSAVSIAHGYAKVAGKPMAVVLHSNVGLMCGLMSIFNAWCDRVPMLILGATGAVDSAVRRSWIDWEHTFRDQGALVRQYVKWDDQPASAQAAVEGMLRAFRMTTTAPCGPAYVILDRRLQEDALKSDVVIPDVERFRPPVMGTPPTEAIEQAAAWLAGAKNPVILMGRMSLRKEDWDSRIRLAELLGARVITDLRTGATFPTDHPLHGGPAEKFPAPMNQEILRNADVVLSLDWYDLEDWMRSIQPNGVASPKIIQVTIDYQIHNGYSGDHQRLAAVDLDIATQPDAVLEPLCKQLTGKHARVAKPYEVIEPARPVVEFSTEVPTLADIGRAMTILRGDTRDFCLIRVPLNWPAGSYQFRHPLDYLGYDGGGGVGSGPGMAVGAAMALSGSGRVPIAIMGDGEFLGAASALWTASHYRIPVLFVVANNRSYFTDEVQQEMVARQRGRPVENRWIGQRIDDPAVSLAGLARDYGVDAEGPVEKASDLLAALRRGLEQVEGGKPYLIDVLVDPERGGAFDWLSSH